MANNITLNHGQLVQLLLEYGQRVRDIQERAWVYSHPSYVEKGLPLLHCALQQYPQLSQGSLSGDAKAHKEFTRNVAEKAQSYANEVLPLITNLKTISQNFLSIGQLLAELHRVLGSLTLRSYPDLLHQYMETFCGAVKAGLLLESVPRRAAAQVAHLACEYLDSKVAESLRATMQDNIFSSSSMVSYLQQLFRASMPRIAQVLELVVGPALSVTDSCDEVASAGLLVIPPVWEYSSMDIDQTGASVPGINSADAAAETSPAMGMYGMTRSQVYPFLRHRESIRQWGLLGFIVFPDILRQVGSSQRLTMLLADGFALHIYKDRIACAHQLALQHIGPAATAALGAPLSPRSGGSPSSGRLGAIFEKGMAIIGGASRLRKSQTGELDAQDTQSIHPLLVDAACSAARTAPMQHRMWRAYLTGQLQNMHALCAASPSRIPTHMEMILAALSLAREEMLWFVRHESRNVPLELAPILSARGLLEGGRLQAVTHSDAQQALELLSAMDAMHRLLVEHQSALSKQIKETIGAELQAHVVSCTPRVEFRLKQAAAQAAGGSATAASPAAASAAGVQPFKDLTDLLRSVLGSCTTPPDAAARVSSACGIWLYVGLQLASVDPPLKAAKVLQYAEDTRYLDVLQKGLDAARLLYERPLLHAAAMDLAPGLQYLVEPILKASQRALSSGCMEDMQAALGAMQGLHWLLPHRAEAQGAVGCGPASGGLQRTSSNPGLGRTSLDIMAQSRPGSSRGMAPTQPDELPKRCMNMVVMCIRQMLSPVVQAPLATTVTLNALARNSGLDGQHGDNALRSRPPSGSLMKAVSARLRPGEASSKSLGSNGGASRATTPERLRPESCNTATTEPLDKCPSQQTQQQATPCPLAVDAAQGPVSWNTAVPAMPTAADLASRLLPLFLALDSGRMLNGGACGHAADGLVVCRSQLVEAVRDNFSQLLANTAIAIGQVSTPLPSVQFAPMRRFIEVMSVLQPQLATELLPELARLMLQQACAPTIQAVGAETAASAGSRPAQQPPSTSAQVAPSTMPNYALLTPSARAGSTAGTSTAGAMGPLARSLSMNGPPPSLRNASGGGSERSVGPMAGALPQSSGGAPPTPSNGNAGAPNTVLRALHAWLWSTVVLDERRQGVAYDTEAGGFNTDSAVGAGAALSGLAAATNIRELALCFELFGPCAAADLTRGSDELLRNCLLQLEAFLDANASPLQELLDAAHLPADQRLAAVQRALPRLASPSGSSGGGSGPAGLGSLADVLQCLGRCMLLRMQLGRAAAIAAERTADFVTLALQELAAPVTVGPGSKVVNDGYEARNRDASEALDAGRREWCALLQLITAGTRTVETSFSGCVLPDRSDPLLSMHLTTMLPSLAAAQRWYKLPALLGALMAAPQWSGSCGSTPAPSRGPSAKGSMGARPPGSALENTSTAMVARHMRMSVITSAAVALSLSLQTAIGQALHPAAGQFLLGCDSPAAAMLCAYQRIAHTVIQAAAGGGSESAAAAKQHALASLDRLPMLRAYSYAPLYADAAAAVVISEDCDGAADLASTVTDSGRSWWQESTVAQSDAAASQQKFQPSEADGCEPSLADGRWACELDAWRPAVRLLPLVLGQVG